MFNISFWLGNPFVKDKFRNILCFNKKLTTNKSFEFQIYYHSISMIEFEVDLSARSDHSGFRSRFGLFGYVIDLCIIDNRHWDYEKNCWE